MRKAWYIYLIGVMVLAGISASSDGWFQKANPTLAFFFFALAGWFWWLYTAPQRKVEDAKKLEEKQKQLELRQEALRQEEALRKQQELENSLSEQNKVRSEDLGRRNLRHHVNEILSAVIRLPGTEEDTKAILIAVNDSINNVLTDSKIVHAYFSEPPIKNDKEIIFAHLEECGMANHVIAKRLRACLDSTGTSS